jgi:hypothetical protein
LPVHDDESTVITFDLPQSDKCVDIQRHECHRCSDRVVREDKTMSRNNDDSTDIGSVEKGRDSVEVRVDLSSIQKKKTRGTTKN